MNWLVHRLVFRAPDPPTYTDVSLYPQLHFCSTLKNEHQELPYCLAHQGSIHPSLEPTKLWILFSHGNSEDLGNVAFWISYLNDCFHIPVLGYDYAGFGLSRTRTDPVPVPSQESIFSDIESILHYAETELNLLPQNCVLWGRSLGCAPSLHIASTVQVAGAILQSPFCSIMSAGTNSLWSNPESDWFRNVDMIPLAKCPVFLIHGEQDWICQVWHSRELEKRVPSHLTWPSLFIPQCGHNDIEAKCDELIHDVYEFIEFCAFRCNNMHDMPMMFAASNA